MAHLIDKDALVAEIERLNKKNNESKNVYDFGTEHALKSILSFIDTLEVKEVGIKHKNDAPIAYVITRSEEHSDYVEEVFFDEDKAQKYCDQFKGNENEYARQTTKVKVTL